MARPIWKGFITFGLVNIPVVLYPAEKKSQIQFRLIDNRNKEPIRYMRVNEHTGKEVPWEHVVKGYEYEDNQYVVMKDEELKSIAGENTKTIDIEAFVPEDAINSTEYEKPYYLVPDKKGEKGYVILREILKNTKKAAIAKVIIHTKQYLAALLPFQNAIILNLIRYKHELREPEEFNLPASNLKTLKITPKEMEVAKQLVASMTTKWDPSAYKDDYQDALEQWIEEKINHEKPHTVMKQKAVPSKQGKVINFVDLLKQSLAESKPRKTKQASKNAHKHLTKKRKAANKQIYHA